MTTLHPKTAWVVFSDETDLSYLRVLKRGFRHCYILISDGEKWMSLDPLSHMTELAFHSFAEPFNLPLWLKSQGHTVVKVALQTPQAKPSPLMFSTCVETVKRVLGLHSRWIITPWQLYRHLQQHKIANIAQRKERIC